MGCVAMLYPPYFMGYYEVVGEGGGMCPYPPYFMGYYEVVREGGGRCRDAVELRYHKVYIIVSDSEST